MPRIYRSMYDDSGKPKTGFGSNRLGVRVPPDPNADVHPDAEGIIQPGHGLSVAPSVSDLRNNHIPKRLKDNCGQAFKRQFRNATGNNALTFWRYGEGSFEPGPLTNRLELVPDQGSPVKHGVVGPKGAIHLDEYENALTSTQDGWINCENETL